MVTVRVGGTARTAGAASPATFDAYLTTAFPGNEVSGMAVAVVKDGQLVTLGFGKSADGIAVRRSPGARDANALRRLGDRA